MTYINQKCPVCNNSFKENDDIVVCPVCGTPHHRDCYAKENKCANQSLHDNNFEWKIAEEPILEQNKAEVSTENDKQQDDGHKILFCPNCGKENPAEEPVCISCGARLYNNPDKKMFSPQVSLPDMSKQQFSTPVVQISPDDTIGGNKVSDTAEYIQLNAERYIPKFFKLEKTGKKLSWNWAAFIFTPYWFFFRKLHIIGFILMLISLLITGSCTTDRFVTTATDFMTVYNQYYEGNATYEQVAQASQKISQLPEAVIMVTGEFAIKLFGGLAANYFYKKKAVSEIREIRLNANSPEDYRLNLFKKGGISGAMCCLSFLGYYCAQQIILILAIG